MKNQTKVYAESGIILAITLLLTITAFNLNQSATSVNSITGDVITRVNVSPLRATACNFTLEPGLNLVSFFCITYETPRADVLANITTLYAIFEYQEIAPDKWKTYNPTLPSWVIQDLTILSRTKGYWMIVNSTEQPYISGGLRIPTNIPLVPGWNLVGYPTNETKPVNESFLSIDGNFSEVRGFNSTTKTFQSFVPPSSGGLRETKPYDGYWINSSVDEVWIVD